MRVLREFGLGTARTEMKASDTESTCPPYVLLDSNVWIKELALQSVKASAVRYFLKITDATLVVPDVVRLQVEDHLRSKMIACRESIQKAHRELLQLMGTQRQITVPTDEEIEAAVPVLIERAGLKMLKPSLTLDVAESSFEKIRRKQSPSQRKEQFVDGVLWAHCLELLDEANTLLVTNDGAFYKDDDPKMGALAPTLVDEALHRKYRICIYKDLEGLLERIRADVAPEDDDLIGEAHSIADDVIRALLDEHRFSLDRGDVVDCKAYFTETPDRLYLHFTVAWQPLVDNTSEERRDGKLTVVMEGAHARPTGFSDAHLNRVAIDYTDASGVPIHGGTVIARANAIRFGGPANEKHTIRVDTRKI